MERDDDDQRDMPFADDVTFDARAFIVSTPENLRACGACSNGSVYLTDTQQACEFAYIEICLLSNKAH